MVNTKLVDKLYKTAIVQDGVETEHDLIHAFANNILDEVFVKLMNMDSKANHRYYIHALFEIKKHFKNEDKETNESNSSTSA